VQKLARLGIFLKRREGWTQKSRWKRATTSFQRLLKFEVFRFAGISRRQCDATERQPGRSLRGSDGVELNASRSQDRRRLRQARSPSSPGNGTPSGQVRIFRYPEKRPPGSLCPESRFAIRRIGAVLPTTVILYFPDPRLAFVV